MRRLFKILKYFSIILCITFAIMGIYPLIFLLSGSIKDTSEITLNLKGILGKGTEYGKWNLLPLYPTLKHYVELLLDSPAYFVMFWNSIKIVFGVLLGQLLIGLPAAYGFSRLTGKIKDKVFFLYIAFMLLPFQVLMLSEYFVIDRMGLMDNLFAIILPGAFSTFPVFIMYHFFKGVPKDVIEAAKIDGAGEFTIFRKIALPLGVPGIISALVLSFLEYWNLIEQPITFIKTESKMPLSLFLPEISTKNGGLAFVVSVITLLPPLLVFLCGEKYLEEGIVKSAGKE